MQDQEVGSLARTMNRLQDINARNQVLKTNAHQASSAVRPQVDAQGQAHRLVPANKALRNKKWRDARKARIQKKLKDGRLTYDPNWKLNKLKAAKDARPKDLATRLVGWGSLQHASVARLETRCWGKCPRS